LSENNENENEIEELSEQRVWEIIEYARAMSSSYGMQFLTPDLINARMRDITLNPMVPDQDKLDQAMRTPKSSERELQAFSQNFELTSMVYKRLMSYLGNMLSFDITYTPTNVKKSSDYITPRFKQDMDSIENYLTKFDYKREFRIAVREMLRNDAFFAVVRETKDGIMLQELPSEFCKITGRWEGGFLFSFNMYWFMQTGVDLDMYPKFFKKKYNELWENGTIRSYNPHLPPELRGQSSWVYWVDIPVDLGVCFKLTPELATRLPYFTPLFNDLILQGMMRNLQKNINMSTANRLLIGEVPMLNEKKATTKDPFGISPDLLGRFLGVVKAAIGESIKVASAPLENMKGISFDSENDVYDSYLRTALASSGINTNLIFSSSVKPNAIETQLSLNVDEQLMTSLYYQFADFLNYHVNKRLKSFRFMFEFEGTEFYTNRSKRLEDAMTLYGQGIILPQKIAAAVGMKPFAFMKHLEMNNTYEFTSMLKFPLQEMQMEAQADSQDKSLEAQADSQEKQLKQQTQQAKQQQAQQAQQAQQVQQPAQVKKTNTTNPKGGRPQKKDSDLSDSALETRDAGSNIAKGGKV
jgi:hypothetical protein